MLEFVQAKVVKFIRKAKRIFFKFIFVYFVQYQKSEDELQEQLNDILFYFYGRKIQLPVSRD